MLLMYILKPFPPNSRYLNPGSISLNPFVYLGTGPRYVMTQLTERFPGSARHRETRSFIIHLDLRDAVHRGVSHCGFRSFYPKHLTIERWICLCLRSPHALAFRVDYISPESPIRVSCGAYNTASSCQAPWDPP